MDYPFVLAVQMEEGDTGDLKFIRKNGMDDSNSDVRRRNEDESASSVVAMGIISATVFILGGVGLLLVRPFIKSRKLRKTMEKDTRNEVALPEA